MKKYFIALIGILAVLLSACTRGTEASIHPYLSITESAFADEAQTEVASRCTTYDLKSDQLQERGLVPYTSQYPLTAYSTNKAAILYSALSACGDQVYADQDGTAEQLTDEFTTLNYIFQCGEKVFLAAKYYGCYGMEPIVMDAKTNVCTGVFRDKADDRFLWAATCDPSRDAVYFTWYSKAEQNKNRDDFHILQTDDSDQLKPPLSTVCKLDLNTNKVTPMFTTELYVADIAVSGDTLIYSALPSAISHQDHKCYRVNLKTKEQELLELPVQFTTNMAIWENTLYGIGYDLEDGKRGVYAVSLDDKEKKLLYEQADDAFINGMSLNY